MEGDPRAAYHRGMQRLPFASLAALLLVLAPARAAEAQTPEAQTSEAQTSEAQTPGAQTPGAQTSEAESGDERHFYLRVDVGAGYGHFVYLTAGRNGGGPVASTSIAIGWRATSGFLIGGWACFDPIVASEGVSSHGEPWGPYFSPGGHFGVVLGYASDVVGFDVAIGAGGGGSHGGGGVGVVVAPTLSVALARVDRFSFGFYVRPELGALVDPATVRPLLLVLGTGGISFRYW